MNRGRQPYDTRRTSSTSLSTIRRQTPFTGSRLRESSIAFQMGVRTAPHVSRKVRASPHARRSLKPLLARLKSSETDWPPHLLGALKILTTELGLPEVKAGSIVLQSVSVAQDCVKAQSKRVDRFEASQAPARIRSTCSRVSNCIKRTPALLLRRLDAEIPALIKHIESDLETIEAIFTVTKTILEDKQYQNSEPVRTAREALAAPRAADYSMLEATVREKVTTALAKLAGSGPQGKAADVFAAIADTLKKERTAKVSLQSRDLRTRYVSDLREIWLKAGLKPKRMLYYVDSSPISPFHRFAELVFVGVAEPWAFSHKNRRPIIDPEPWLALRRANYRWEISDDHVRKALAP